MSACKPAFLSIYSTYHVPTSKNQRRIPRRNSASTGSCPRPFCSSVIRNLGPVRLDHLFFENKSSADSGYLAWVSHYSGARTGHPTQPYCAPRTTVHMPECAVQSAAEPMIFASGHSPSQWFQDYTCSCAPTRSCGCCCGRVCDSDQSRRTRSPSWLHTATRLETC